MSNMIRRAIVEGMRIALFTPIEEVQAALDAAVDAASPEPVAVRVNELVWMKAPGHLDAEWCDEFGLYQISENILFIGHTETGDVFKSLKAAQSAAQADYEARILSVITSRPEAEVRADGWAAAVEAAANDIECGCEGGVCRFPASCPQGDIEDIRALTPPADIAPLLAKRDARVREQALREAALVARRKAKDFCDPEEIESSDGAHAAADAILALIGGAA